MSESAVHLLDQAAGYGVLVGVGALFAGGMILTTFCCKDIFMKTQTVQKPLQLQIDQWVLSFLPLLFIQVGVGVLNSCLFR